MLHYSLKLSFDLRLTNVEIKRVRVHMVFILPPPPFHNSHVSQVEEIKGGATHMALGRLWIKAGLVIDR